MQNTFEQINEYLESLELIFKNNAVPQIEKDIVLERLRKLYVNIQTGVSEVSEQPDSNISEKFEVHQGLEEDVDLFFDTDDESYGHHQSLAGQEAELQKEIEREEEQKRLEEEQKRITEEQRRKAEEEQRRIAEEQRRKAEEEQRRIAEEQRRKAEEERKKAEAKQQPSDEDDLLQFMPKNNPQQHTAATQSTNKLTSQTPQRSLNDLFTDKREDRSLSAQFQHAKVADLTKAISINDKFTYIKELFNNKGEEFSAAITRLNQCQNMDEAFDVLEKLKQTFYWDSTSTAYLSLCDLLRRKFV